MYIYTTHFFFMLSIFLLTFAVAVPGHGLWMFQYGDKRPMFDVLSPEGTDLSLMMSVIYLFLTMIIVFQVRNWEKGDGQRPSETQGQTYRDKPYQYF